MPATPISRIDGMTTSVAVKAPCICTTSAAITLSGEQTVGGFPAMEGDRVLVKDQADAVENGIYIVSTGTWTRAPDFDGARDAVFGTLVVVVSEGSTNGILFRVTCDDSPIVFGTSEITFELQSNSSLILNIIEAGAVAGNVGDQGPIINSTISGLSAAGGGGIYFPPGDYRHTTGVIQGSNVTLWGERGATLVWAGGATPQVTSPSSGCLLKAGITGINLNSAGASKSIEILSGWHCTHRDITITTNSATSIVLDYTCNATGAVSPSTNYNTAYCYGDNILQTGTCGTFIRLRGLGFGAPADRIVTLCNFMNCQAEGVSVIGVDFSQWADSNYFGGVMRIGLIASNAVGVVWNSASPTSNVGVYADNFEHLAVDTFVIGGVTGRVGWKMNWTKYNQIAFYYNDPAAEGGSYIITSDCLSYDFVIAADQNVMGEGKTNENYHRTTASYKSEGVYHMDIGTVGTGDLRFFAGATMQMRISHGITAVNYWDVLGGATGTGIVMRAEGTNTNVGMLIASKGTGQIVLATNQNSGGNNIGIVITHVASAVNYIELQQNVTLNAPVLRGAGTDTNVSLALQSKGTGSLLLGTNSNVNQVLVTHTASADRTINMTGSNGGNPAISTSAGSLDVAAAVVFTGQTVGTTVGAAGGASALPLTPLGYITTAINGTACKIPYYNT